ncbi:MAG: ABC transporter substrate-binding protein [Clostridium sp.]
MKKYSKLALLLVMLFSVSFGLISCGKEEENKGLTKVRLNEVVRSVFYAPMYVAINEGFFKEEGLEIDLSTGQGADKVMQNVLSKNADIGFCGPEQVIYIYNQGREDYPKVFAQLTQRDGSFLVGRTTEENFTWENLREKEVIGGRPGGVPEMALEYVMRNRGLTPKVDVKMVTNIDFTATAGAFKAGTADYVALFEPTASMLEKDGGGKIVASIGESAGDLPYTCFMATQSYMKDNPEVIKAFTKAIYKGQQWVDTHSSEEVADVVSSFFPGTDKQILINVINNYKKIDAYAKTPVVKEESLNRLMDIIQSYDSKLIPTRPEFNKVVETSYAEEVVKEK